MFSSNSFQKLIKITHKNNRFHHFIQDIQLGLHEVNLKLNPNSRPPPITKETPNNKANSKPQPIKTQLVTQNQTPDIFQHSFNLQCSLLTSTKTNMVYIQNPIKHKKA